MTDVTGYSTFSDPAFDPYDDSPHSAHEVAEILSATATGSDLGYDGDDVVLHYPDGDTSILTHKGQPPCASFQLTTPSGDVYTITVTPGELSQNLTLPTPTEASPERATLIARALTGEWTPAEERAFRTGSDL
jgi:hypothetical protein